MFDIKTCTGRIVELRRFMNRVPRLTEHDPSRERWEVWLAEPEGGERKFLVSSRFMPARVGHAVDLLHVGGTPVALYNLDTGVRINFTRADPALLLRRLDAAVMSCAAWICLVLAVTAGPLALAVAVMAAVLYLPLVVVGRLVARTTLQRHTDRLLDRIQIDHVVRPLRRRG